MKSHDPPLPTAQDYVASLVDTGTWKCFQVQSKLGLLVSLFDTFLFTCRLKSYLKSHKLFQSMSIEMLLKHFLSLFVGRKEFLYNKIKKVNINSVATMIIPNEQAYLKTLVEKGDK